MYSTNIVKRLFGILKVKSYTELQDAENKIIKTFIYIYIFGINIFWITIQGNISKCYIGRGDKILKEISTTNETQWEISKQYIGDRANAEKENSNSIQPVESTKKINAEKLIKHKPLITSLINKINVSITEACFDVVTKCFTPSVELSVDGDVFDFIKMEVEKAGWSLSKYSEPNLYIMTPDQRKLSSVRVIVSSVASEVYDVLLPDAQWYLDMALGFLINGEVFFIWSKDLPSTTQDNKKLTLYDNMKISSLTSLERDLVNRKLIQAVKDRFLSIDIKMTQVTDIRYKLVSI